MRLVAGALALTLFASFARADDNRPTEPAEPTPAAAAVAHGKVPLRVVRVMPESRQALLFDRTRSTHVLAEVGGKIDGYTVDAIDDDEVTLSAEGKQIVLAAPARGARRHDRDAAGDAAVHARSAAEPTPPERAAGDPAPVDPYGDPPIRVVEAPTAPAPADARTRAPRAEARAAAAPDKQTLDARALADVMTADSRRHAARAPAALEREPAAPTAGSRPAATGQPGLPGLPASEIRTTSAGPGDAIVLARGDVDGALADFAGLAAAVRGSFSASGLTVDAVADGTIFQRAGLRPGDIVTAVDGARLRSLDDAANLYARASTARAITAQIIRSGKPMALRVAIQ